MISIWKNRINQLLTQLQSIGVTSEMDFLEKKKTEVINIIMLLSIPLIGYFIILNLIQERFGLFFLNIGVISIAIIILVFHKFHLLLAGRLFISFGFIIFYSLEALLYRNGTENFFYFNLIITLIFYSNKKLIYAMAILNCLIYIGIKIALNSNFYFDTVPKGRVIFNASWAICSSAIALLFFKYQQAAYSYKIEQQNIELEKSNKTKEKFFSIIAHDLRTPIAQLKSAMDLVNKNYISKEEFNSLSIGLTKQIEEVQESLDDLLIWSQHQLQGIQNRPKYIDVKIAIDTILAPILPQSNAKKIKLNNLTDDMQIWIDPDQFKLVIRNLVTNAIKFSYPNSSIEIASTCSNNKVIITITDHGIGISEDVLAKLFTNSFYTSKGTAHEKGTGIGLQLCKEFLEKSNASINVTSKLGKGTSFFITFPMHE